MNLSLATRIFLGYAVVLATFGAVSLFSVGEMHRNQQEIRLVSQGYLHLSQDTSAIESFHKNQEHDTARLLGEKNVETRRFLIKLARQYFPPQMADRVASAKERAHAALAFAPESESAFLRDLEQRFADLAVRYKQYEQMSDSVFTRLERAEPDWNAAADEMAELKQLESSIGRDIRVLHQSIEARIRERVEGAERRERRTGITIIALSVLAIGVGLLVTALSARALRPVRTLIEGVSRIGKGDYSAQLGVQGQDEIAVLAREFDQMARSLREREAQLAEKQQALVRAEKLAAVGRLSAQVAHEVRNPLSSIGLNAELLEEGLARARFDDPADQAEAIDILHAITREVDRLAEITEEYLRMARLPAPHLTAGDLNEVIARVLDFSQAELDRANVKVERRLDEALPRALIDDGQVRQVFLNLIRNAREAMPEGGTLTVESRALPDAVEVVFRDTGRGMTPEVQQRIFEPFFTTKQSGTGLGLAVARQILQAHGGELSCESTPSVGTTFRIVLPRAAEAAKPAA
ncbi:MAG: HAMP domain-containing protein [Myxococcaceae bacterium]|nr:HAMP domain-containing protein [Myxococcaceae bacterium]